MKLEKIITRTLSNKQEIKSYQLLENLIESLNSKKLTDAFVDKTNEDISELNRIPDNDTSLRKAIGKKKSRILNRVIKDLKYTPKNYYMTLGMSIGMAALGIPFGAAFSFALDSFAFFSIGLPIGLAIGLAIGVGLDKKSLDEGRQLY